jgi:uroporphyrin-III C-methyltransferase
MSQDDLTPERSTAPIGVPPDTARASRPPTPARSGGGAQALALLLALLAIVGVGYLAWRQWQITHVSAKTAQATVGLEDRVNTLEHSLSGATGQNNTLMQRLNDADQVNRSLREELLSQDQRVRDMEEAVGRLSEKTLSGQDAMRLDETESLLRMGTERYTLFHDAQGAAQAYALASQTLAGVNDSAFNGVRESIDAEHEALLKSHPADRQQELDAVAQLRGDLPQWPLKPLDEPASSNDDGLWARLRRALHSVITIQHDQGDGQISGIADARIMREMTALDLAQAQAALMTWDDDAAIAALKRVDASLAAQFDLQSKDVQQARQHIAALIGQITPAMPVKLGGALSELRNLRAVHALKPDTNTSAAPANGTKP